MKTKHSFWGRYFPLLIILTAIISACDSSTLSGDDPSDGPGGSQGTGWNKDQPNNAIFYKTNTGSIISIAPNSIIAYGANEEKANIISNTYSEEGIGKIVFDKDLRAIAYKAFYKSNLTSISIPSGVTEIGEYAFDRCSNLTSITIPSSVTEIQNQAFSECSSLTSINIPSGVTRIGDGAFCYCSSLTSISIPSGVTEIGGYAFSGCSSLTSVNISSGVTVIGFYAFSGCSSLTSINIPAGVTEIGGFAFRGCSSLTSINIPSGVTEIGHYAFSGCSSLTSINIPSGVTKIGKSAFSECSSLATVTVLAPNPPRCDYGNTFENTPCIIYVPSESVDAYKSAWPAYADRIQPIQK